MTPRVSFNLKLSVTKKIFSYPYQPKNLIKQLVVAKTKKVNKVLRHPLHKSWFLILMSTKEKVGLILLPQMLKLYKTISNSFVKKRKTIKEPAAKI